MEEILYTETSSPSLMFLGSRQHHCEKHRNINEFKLPPMHRTTDVCNLSEPLRQQVQAPGRKIGGQKSCTRSLRFLTNQAGETRASNASKREGKGNSKGNTKPRSEANQVGRTVGRGRIESCFQFQSEVGRQSGATIVFKR